MAMNDEVGWGYLGCEGLCTATTNVESGGRHPLEYVGIGARQKDTAGSERARNSIRRFSSWSVADQLRQFQLVSKELLYGVLERSIELKEIDGAISVILPPLSAGEGGRVNSIIHHK
jgi:hypothetical protein